jgi:hypothetical protein
MSRSILNTTICWPLCPTIDGSDGYRTSSAGPPRPREARLRVLRGCQERVRSAPPRKVGCIKKAAALCRLEFRKALPLNRPSLRKTEPWRATLVSPDGRCSKATDRGVSMSVCPASRLVTGFLGGTVNDVISDCVSGRQVCSFSERLYAS